MRRPFGRTSQCIESRIESMSKGSETSLLGTRDYGLEAAPPLTGPRFEHCLPSACVWWLSACWPGSPTSRGPSGTSFPPAWSVLAWRATSKSQGSPLRGSFISLDIVSGALMILVAAALWARPARRPLLAWAILGYALFGVSTAVSAAVPLSCGVGRAALLACGTSPSSYGFHDAISVVGYLALFVSLLGCLSCSRKAQGRSGLGY